MLWPIPSLWQSIEPRRARSRNVLCHLPSPRDSDAGRSQVEKPHRMNYTLSSKTQFGTFELDAPERRVNGSPKKSSSISLQMIKVEMVWR